MKTGPLIIDLNTTVLQADEIPLLQHEFVGGIILFSRNYHSSKQLRELVGAIKNVRADLLITVEVPEQIKSIEKGALGRSLLNELEQSSLIQSGWSYRVFVKTLSDWHGCEGTKS